MRLLRKWGGRGWKQEQLWNFKPETLKCQIMKTFLEGFYLCIYLSVYSFIHVFIYLFIYLLSYNNSGKNAPLIHLEISAAGGAVSQTSAKVLQIWIQHSWLDSTRLLVWLILSMLSPPFQGPLHEAHGANSATAQIGTSNSGYVSNLHLCCDKCYCPGNKIKTWPSNRTCSRQRQAGWKRKKKVPQCDNDYHYYSKQWHWNRKESRK